MKFKQKIKKKLYSIFALKISNNYNKLLVFAKNAKNQIKQTNGIEFWKWRKEKKNAQKLLVARTEETANFCPALWKCERPITNAQRCK